MAKVVYTLPNPPKVANGYAFMREGDEVVSQELPEDVAAYFLLIPGYKAWEPPAPPAPAKGAKPPPAPPTPTPQPAAAA